MRKTLQISRPKIDLKDVQIDVRGVVPYIYTIKATYDDLEIGWIGLETNFSYSNGRLAWISNFEVKPYEKCGVGSLLLKMAEEIGVHDGMKCAGLEPRPHDPDKKGKLISFYKERGYRFDFSQINMIKKLTSMR